MQRREYIGATISALGTGFLAGCTGDTSTHEGTTTPTAQPDKAAEHLEEAGSALQSAGEQLSSESESLSESEFEDGSVDFNPSKVYTYLDEAANELDAAEEYSTDEQRSKINSGREYIEFGRKITDFLDIVVEGYSLVYSGLTYFQSERYTDAAAELEAAEQKLGDADDLLSVVRDRTSQLETEELDDFDKVDAETLQIDLTTLDELIPVLETMATGIREMSLGMEDLNEAESYLDEEALTQAQKALDRAAEHFGTSESLFKRQEGESPSSIKSTFIELTCYAGSLKDGTEHFSRAVEAIGEGDNERAKEERDKASESYNKCNFDS
ncbi:hypothetical protein [Haloferax chudinovii]|uniref:DUF3829 domain-containing protein n=1 Tax=Haloferax chudinovii TaxID=1109010 RepID=A0ABD5XP24_9EURY